MFEDELELVYAVIDRVVARGKRRLYMTERIKFNFSLHIATCAGIFMLQYTTSVIYVKVLVIVVEICTTFKDDSNM